MAKESLLAAKKPHKCKQCDGLAPYDSERGGWACVNCGRLEVDRVKRHEFLEYHKEEILRDMLTIGPIKTRAKWGLPPATLNNLKLRWGLRQIWWAPGMRSFSRDGLPKLPAWHNDWPPEFKMLWLETYSAIVKSGEVKDVKPKDKVRAIDLVKPT